MNAPEPFDEYRAGSVCAGRAAGADVFNSGRVEPDEEFRYTFTVPGRYDHFCMSHESVPMFGTVIVEELPPDQE